MVTGDEIQEARNKLGESQGQFGDRLGVDQSTIHRWEKNGPPQNGAARKAIEELISQLPTPESVG